MGAGVLGEFEHHQTHGARAVDQHLGAERAAEHVVAAHRAGQRLDQCRVLHIDVPGELDAVRDGCDGVLRGSAGLADADRIPALAQVATADTAVVTLVAVQRGIDGDQVAQGQLVDVGAQSHDLTGELMAGDDRQGRRELALEDVQIGTAQPACRDPDDDVTGARGRIGNRRHRHFADGLDDRCPHFTAPRERP